MTETRLPFHRHLKWLILDGFDNATIHQFYDNIQFPIPSTEQIEQADEQLKTLIIPGATRRRLAKRIFDEGDQGVWKKHGFEEIYLHTLKKIDWPEIGRVLNHPVMRVALDCCLISSVDTEKITQLLPVTFSLAMSPESIAVYKKYFLDVDLMNKSDWQSYLRILQPDRYVHERIFAALTRNQDEVLHLVGLPTKTQFGTMLKNIMSTAHYRFEYYSRQMTPESQEEARKWAKVMIEAGVKHDRYSAADATDFSDLVQTEFIHLDTKIETISSEMLADAKPKIEEKDTKIDAPVPPPPPK